VRSPREIAFRLAQESTNLWLFAFRPSTVAKPKAPLSGLPDPEPVFAQLRQSDFAAEVQAIADLALAKRFSIFGDIVDAGQPTRWRRDFRSGIESGLGFFRRTPYLDPAHTGDHKLVWEMNRHQHLVAMAQAYGLSGRRELLDEIERHLESWNDANPWMRGMNWTSALEVAFRALSWLWVYHLAGNALGERLRGMLADGLYRHGRYLENNLSFYFAPNTHLLGEAVALHALGRLLPELPRAAQWARVGRQVTEAQMFRQVREDGSHFEQSAYYHLYALDMFLFHQILEQGTREYCERLERMAEYLDALIGPGELLPTVGDDDGGRFFHPFGERQLFARATLATCGVVFSRPDWIRSPERLHEQAFWWLGPIRPPVAACVASRSRHFRDSGTAVMESDLLHVVFDGGPFARGPAGHSHGDSLSIVAQSTGVEVLVDSGTYTYVEDTERERFRSTAAHNTVRVDGLEQGTPANSFAWSGKPEVRMEHWVCEGDHVAAQAVCRYGNITHRRTCSLAGAGNSVLILVDEVEGPAGEHLIEQFWHCAGHVEQESSSIFLINGRASLTVAGKPNIRMEEGGLHGWRSTVFGRKQPASVLTISIRDTLPAILITAIDAQITGGPRSVRAAGATDCIYTRGERCFGFDWRTFKWSFGGAS
jgi:hypothetical protein